MSIHTTKTIDLWNGPELLSSALFSLANSSNSGEVLCSTLLFKPGNLSCIRSNSESMVVLATCSVDKNNFIHFPPGLMILKTYLSIVVFVPVHLDGESWLLFTPWERNFIKIVK